MSERHTSLELHSAILLVVRSDKKVVKRLELLDNITKNNKDRRRPYSFYYGKFDEEQSYGRFW